MKHQTISFIKSGLRLAGYVGVASTVLALFYLTTTNAALWFWFGGWALLILSEVVGILEEIGHD